MKPHDEASLLNNYAKLGTAQKDYVVLPQGISTDALALGLRKGETGVKTLVDGVLRDLEKSGEGEKLFFKWYGPKTNLKFEKRTFKFNSGKIDVNATYKFSLNDDVDFKADVSKIALTDLAVRPKNSDIDWVTVPELIVSGTTVDLKPRRAHSDSLSLTGVKLVTWLGAVSGNSSM